MTLNNKGIYLVCLALVLGFGCGGAKHLVKVPVKSLEQVIEGNQKNQRDYTWFSAKAKVKFEGESTSIGGRATIRMIKDSLIWMNFKKLSIEGSRILITRDSFWIAYRLDNLYESGTLQELLIAYDLDLSFREFQNFIIGNLEIPEKEKISSFRSADLYELYFNKVGENHRYFLNKDFYVSKFLFQDQFNRYLEVHNDSFEDDLFAYDRIIVADLGDGNKSKISLSFSDVEFNVAKSVPFEIPSHYVRLP